MSSGVYAFRGEIRHMLKHMHIKKANIMGNEVELEPDLGKADRLTANLQASSPSPSETRASFTVTEAPDSFTAIGDARTGLFTSPAFIQSARVNSAWTNLIAYMRVLRDKDAASHNPRLKWREPEPLQELASELGLDPSEVGALTALEAAHQRLMRTPNPEVTGEEATRFEEIVRRLQRKLRVPKFI